MGNNECNNKTEFLIDKFYYYVGFLDTLIEITSMVFAENWHHGLKMLREYLIDAIGVLKENE